MRVLGERRRILTQSGRPRRPNACARDFLPVTAETRLTSRYRARVNSVLRQAVLGVVPPKKEQTMKTSTFHLLSLAGLAVSALAASVPALAHDGYFYGRAHYGRPYFA